MRALADGSTRALFASIPFREVFVILALFFARVKALCVQVLHKSPSSS